MSLWDRLKNKLGLRSEEPFVWDWADGAIQAIGQRISKRGAADGIEAPAGWVYDGAGKLRSIVNSAGVLPVTEADAASISVYTNGSVVAIENLNPTIAQGTFAYGGVGYHKHRIGRAVITCDGAGVWANQSLVPALAGYYGVCKILSIKSNVGVAAGAGTITFESPAGTAALPSVEVCPALAANQRNRDWLDGTVITHATLVDAQAIVCDGAGFGIGTIVEIFFEYWYET